MSEKHQSVCLTNIKWCYMKQTSINVSYKRLWVCLVNINLCVYLTNINWCFWQTSIGVSYWTWILLFDKQQTMCLKISIGMSEKHQSVCLTNINQCVWPTSIGVTDKHQSECLWNNIRCVWKTSIDVSDEHQSGNALRHQSTTFSQLVRCQHFWIVNFCFYSLIKQVF